MDPLAAWLGMHRVRNGRLGVNRLSRREKARWRMLALNGEFYDRDRLRAALADQARRGLAAPVVPHSRRRLTRAELDAIADPNPWRLWNK